jgi:hypothetical protein
MSPPSAVHRRESPALRVPRPPPSHHRSVPSVTLSAANGSRPRRSDRPPPFHHRSVPSVTLSAANGSRARRSDRPPPDPSSELRPLPSHHRQSPACHPERSERVPPAPFSSQICSAPQPKMSRSPQNRQVQSPLYPLRPSNHCLRHHNSEMFHPLVRFDRISPLTITIQCDNLPPNEGEILHGGSQTNKTRQFVAADSGRTGRGIVAEGLAAPRKPSFGRFRTSGDDFSGQTRP